MSSKNQTENSSNGLKYIDLFCGIGGFHQVLRGLGHTCVFASDKDKACRDTYKDNYGLEPAGDITKVKTEDIPDFDILCGGFPCFVAGTRVLTETGYKPIEDVKLEEKLMTHTGNFQNILNLQRKSYNGLLYNINVKYHPETIVCTNEHPFYIKRKNKFWNNKERKYNYKYDDAEWITAENLKKEDYFGMSINNENIIPEFTVNIKVNQYTNKEETIVLNDNNMWFMMGYFLGDGWIEDTKKKNGLPTYKICFAIHNKDFEKVFNKINTILPISDKKCNTGEYCKKYGCSNQAWYTILKEFGKYAHNKKIPEWVQNAPKEFIKEFIDGYFTADGNNNKDGCIQFTTVSSNVAYGIQRLYLKLGHIFGISKSVMPEKTIIEGRTVNQRNLYKIRGWTNLKKKSLGFIENNYAWFPQKNIETCETRNTYVYNFEVENDNSYVVENIVCHNCQPFSNAGKKKSLDDERGGMFDEIMRIVKEKNPRFMFLENVKNIMKIDNGEVIKYIKHKLEKHGYKLQLLQMSPHEYGIPQQRERIYFICVRNDIYDGDVKLKYEKVERANMDFRKYLDKPEDVDEKYFVSGDVLTCLEAWEEMIKEFEVNEKISPTIMANEFHKNYSEEEFKALATWRQDYITRNRPLYNKYKDKWDAWYEKNSKILNTREIYAKLEWQVGTIKENDSIYNYFIQMRQSGARVKKTQYFPTLVAISQIPIYGKEKRYLTPRECLRIQSFPESFKLHTNDRQSYKQAGNSINIENARNVIESTLEKYI